ncbi:hypothetical protein ABZ926_13355 [Streptomyces litmocidini]|uniref:hypothetical protein n=1 Tax=Streptomyces litmocidini TaxID=67318 RepID=UPI0033F1C925
MNLFSRLGNALLDRLAPETSAAAGYICSYGCGSGYFKETQCIGPKMYVRCCQGGGGYCGGWEYCGYQCV